MPGNQRKEQTLREGIIYPSPIPAELTRKDPTVHLKFIEFPWHPLASFLPF